MKPGLPSDQPSSAPIPRTILGYVSVKGARSVFGAPATRGPMTCAPYRAKKNDRQQVRRLL